MDKPTILVADGDPKNLQILRESLEASGLEVIVASDGHQAWQKISSGAPDLILSEVNLPKLDGFQLLEKLKSEPVTSSIPVMFLTNRRELQDRVRSLRGGVKDYMIKPLHVKEVLARIRMILRRIERVKEDEGDSTRKLVGRLEEYSPVDLIESFGVERKTGVLTLQNENNRNGEIYFRDGAVINASLGNLKAEKAVYQILPWKRGHFSMVFKEINVEDEISVSNLGLLLQGFKHIEERERLFKLLPSPETTFVLTETFRSILQKRELTTDVQKFVNLINGKRDLLQIIDESNYDDIKTLERLVKLYQQGFIKPSKSAVDSDLDEEPLPATLAEPKVLEKFSSEFDERRATKTTASPHPNNKAPEIPPSGPASSLPGKKRLEKRLITDEEDDNHRSAPTKEADSARNDRSFEETAVFNARTEIWPDQVWEEDKLSDARLSEPPDADSSATSGEIEINEEVDDYENNRQATQFDQIVRNAGFGLSPEPGFIEPELLPIDLAEILKRPVAPPIFLQPEGDQQNKDLPEPVSEFPEDLEKPEATPSVVAQSKPSAEYVAEKEPVSARDEDKPLVKEQPLVEDQAQAFPEPVPQPPKGQSFERPASLKANLLKDQPLKAFERPETAHYDEPKLQPAGTASVLPSKSQDFEGVISSQLERLFIQRKPKRPKLVVIGSIGEHISALTKTLLGPQSSVKNMASGSFQHFEMGERSLTVGPPLDVIGISMEQQFTKLLSTVAQDLIGYILLIEAHRRDDLAYLGYLLSVLKANFKVPFGIALVKSQTSKNLHTDTLRDLLNAESSDFLLECNPSDLKSVSSFLEGLAGEANLVRWQPGTEKTVTS